MTSKKHTPSFTLSEYCLNNVGRVFDGISYGKIDTPQESGEKRAAPEYLDEFGNKRLKKDIAVELGISESSVSRLYSEFFYDHKAVFEHVRNKRKCKVALDALAIEAGKIKRSNTFRFDDGSQTTSVALSKLYGVQRQFVSRIYQNYNNDHIAANKVIKAHGERIRPRKGVA